MNVCRSLSALDPQMNFHFAFLLKFEANFAFCFLFIDKGSVWFALVICFESGSVRTSYDTLPKIAKNHFIKIIVKTTSGGLPMNKRFFKPN